MFVFYSAIHKADGSLVTDHSLQNGKMSMGNRRTERCPEVILYGGRQSGGFVNSAVREVVLGWWKIKCIIIISSNRFCHEHLRQICTQFLLTISL